MKKTLLIVAVAILVIVIGAGAAQFLSSQRGEVVPGGDQPVPGPANPSESAQAAQPDWCPRVEVLSAPGTWESKADDDPLNPTANPRSFMLSITGPLQQQYASDDVKVWTLPYTAQFKNINAQNEMTYDASREEGRAKAEAELRFMHDQCPATKFVLAGFSQGAVLLGDAADEIGAGRGAVPAESVAGVALIADGRRENGVGANPGVELGGIGAEIALEPVSALVQPIVPGATMRGKRPNGFGQLADKTVEICAPNDSICDAPRDAANGFERALGLIQANGVHALYATNPDVIPGTTANQWVVDWARRTIDGI